ncbi:MAG: S46 family peptidase, partial [Vicinamibacterales bacterium]|nr:S46 family peptidase [Vicinamibacterales bacterium]
LPAGQRIEPLDQAIGLTASMDAAASGAAIDKYLDGIYAATKLADRDLRLAMLDKSTAELAAGGDPFVKLAAALEPLVEANREAAKDRTGAYARIRPVYMDAMVERAGGLLAPDANSTLRVTFGQVKGVDARDGLFYKPQTTLRGILEKHTGEGEFNAPQKQLDAIRALRAGRKTPFFDAGVDDVPVNFLSTVDTTGGNSGSPTLNGRGELVGLLFDGTYESVSSNYLFDEAKTRSIHVDVRYMLWTMAEVDGAVRLLDEMGVSAAPAVAPTAPAAVPGAGR